MTKQKNTYKISREERATLLIGAAIMIGFVLFVSIATQGSLEFYTRLHVVTAIFMVCVVFIRNVSKAVVRIALVLGLVGVISAIFLLLAYYPGYMSHLEYLKSIQ